MLGSGNSSSTRDWPKLKSPNFKPSLENITTTWLKEKKFRVKMTLLRKTYKAKNRLERDKLQISKEKKYKPLISYVMKCSQKSEICALISSRLKNSNYQPRQDSLYYKIINSLLSSSFNPNSPKSWFSKIKTWSKKCIIWKRIWKYTKKLKKNLPKGPTILGELSRNLQQKLANSKRKTKNLKRQNKNKN